MAHEIDPNKQRQDRLVFGGMAGANVLVVLEILGYGKMDVALVIALGLSSVALPLLGLGIMILSVEAQVRYSGDPLYVRAPTYAAPILSFLAINSVFFHFSCIFGFLFLGISVIALFLFRRFYKYSRDLNLQISDDDEKGG